MNIPGISLLRISFILGLFFCFTSFQPNTTSQDFSSSKISNAIPKKKIIFIAGACSHGPGEHEYKAGCMLLADALNKTFPQSVEATVIRSWPKDSTVFENAASVVLFVDGQNGHLVLDHLDQMEALMQKGTGFVALHYAVEVPKEKAGPQFQNWLGGFFEIDWSVNPFWEAQFKTLPDHPITRGVQPFSLTDEWYYHMRFRENMAGVTPILTAIPPASTLDRPDGPHENNPYVRAEKGQPQHVAWASVRPDGGRGFGFTGGHIHKNWLNDNFRRTVLNGILWTAQVEIPKKGFPLQPLTKQALNAHLEIKPCR